MPGHPHAAAGNGTRPQRQLQLQRQKRTHRRHPGLRGQRAQPVHRH